MLTGIHTLTGQEALAVQLGQSPKRILELGHIVSRTSATVPAMAILALEDTTISALVDTFGGAATDFCEFSAVVLAAGTVIYGSFTTVTISAGKCVLYLA